MRAMSEEPAEKNAIDIVLFDLGGVLIDPGGVTPMREMSGVADDDELWRRWLSCRWVRAYESGQCSDEAFAAGMVEDWQLKITADAFMAEFAGWPHPLLPGAVELVSETRARRPVGCLSNTNALQWGAYRHQWPLLDELTFQFLSFELGLVKPDREIFHAVADKLPVPRESVLFIDDNLVNVEAASDSGFQAVHARGPTEARCALVELGVLA
jgi:putative hydrolase of the HAD superfamily